MAVRTFTFGDPDQFSLIILQDVLSRGRDEFTYFIRRQLTRTGYSRALDNAMAVNVANLGPVFAVVELEQGKVNEFAPV